MREKITTKIQNLLNFIDELCEQEIITYPIDYEIEHPSDLDLAATLRCWFGGDRWSEEGDSFVQFGQDGTGSLFLLWFYPSLKIEPPVVFLGSEGESCLVAANIGDFIYQLASSKIFFDGEWIDPEPDEKQTLDWQQLKLTVENKLGKNDKLPTQIRDLAVKIHPNFASWVESKIDY